MGGFGNRKPGVVPQDICGALYLGSRSLKRKEPHPRWVSLKSGSLHPRLTLSSPLLTPSSPYYKIVNSTRRGTGFGPNGAGLFPVPTWEKKHGSPKKRLRN